MAGKNIKIVDPFSKYFVLKNYVLKTNFKSFLACLENIDILIQKSEPIPTYLIKDYFEYFYYMEEEEVKNFEAKIILISEETLKFFSKKKVFQFNGKEKQRSELEFKLDECIKTILYGYKLIFLGQLSNQNYKDEDSYIRKRLLNYFYNSLSVYSLPYNTSDTLLLSHYKKVVIAAYITQKLGYLFTTKSPLTNKLLFDTAKKHISSGK